MLHFKADVRTLVFVAGCYVLVALEWRFLPWRPCFLAVAIAVTASAAWICAVIAHNALHCPVFVPRWANRVFQVVLTCAYGFPVTEYVPGHNLSHHEHTQKRADVMRTSKTRFIRCNALNLLSFFPRVAASVTVQNYRFARLARRTSPAWHRQLVLEAAIGWGSKLALLLLDWKRCVAFVLLPHAWAVYGITTVNLLQHDGCDEDHPFNHSRSFVGPLLNFFTFNNGFHGAHHDQPRLHWSLLPEAHRQRIRPRVDPTLEQRSLLGYLFRTYVASLRRTRFDGSALHLPPKGPDAEWIPRRFLADCPENPHA
jgi:fatty acid desaturase